MKPGARLNEVTWAALMLVLLVYPVVYSSGFMGDIVRPIETDTRAVSDAR